MVEEMRMIRWIYDYSRLDIIINEVFIQKVGVAPIKEKDEGD